MYKFYRELDQGLKKPERAEIVACLTLMFELLKHPLNQ